MQFHMHATTMQRPMSIPKTPDELRRLQAKLGRETPATWEGNLEAVSIGACFVVFEKGIEGSGGPGDRGWAAAATLQPEGHVSICVVDGEAKAAYRAGELILRAGHLLMDAIEGLLVAPDILLINATGRDHPRRAGLALHLGYLMGIPTVGVTHRPLVASGDWPPDMDGAATALTIGDAKVGYWYRSVRGTRPLAVHAGWQTSPDLALKIIRSVSSGVRTPEPLRVARRAARMARAGRL